MPDGSIPAEDPTAVRLALADVVRDYGPAALDDARLIGRMLPDLLSSAPRATALVTAAANGSVGRLLGERIAVGMPPPLAISDVGTALSGTSLLQAPACVWIVGEYAAALGMVSPAQLDALRSASAPADPAPVSGSPAPGRPPAGFSPQPAPPAPGWPPAGFSPQPASPAPGYASPGPPGQAPPAGYPGYPAPHPGYPAAAPPGYAAPPAGYAPAGYAPTGYAPPGYPVPAYVAAPVGYAAPARTPVPRAGFRITASVAFYLLGLGALVGYRTDTLSVPSPTVWVPCAVIFALTGVYVSTRVVGTMIVLLVAIGAGVVRYLVLPAIADAADLSSLSYPVARVLGWTVPVIMAITALAVVMLAIGESGPAADRVDAAGSHLRRPPVVTTAGWLLLALTFFELYIDLQLHFFDPWMCLLPALGAAVWQGSRGGHVLGLVVAGLALVRDGQTLYDIRDTSDPYYSTVRGYVVIEVVFLVAVAVVLVLAAKQPYFGSGPRAPLGYPAPQPAQAWHHVPTQAAPGGTGGQPPGPAPATTVD